MAAASEESELEPGALDREIAVAGILKLLQILRCLMKEI